MAWMTGLRFPSSSQLSIQENLSVSLWVELNSLSDGNFLKNSNNGWEWELRYSNIQGARSTIQQLDGSFPHNNVFSNKSLNLNRFTNLISVFSYNKFLKLYIDGRLAASSSSFTASFGAGNSPCILVLEKDGLAIQIHLGRSKLHRRHSHLRPCLVGG